MTTPTAEQHEVIDTYGDGLDMVIQAGAGSGKSSTLEMIGRSDPRRQMTYMAYNKPIAVEARRKFPKNVICKTSHSLAYDWTYGPRLARPHQSTYDSSQALGVDDIMRAAKASNSRGLTGRVIMRVALDTVMAWCYSADQDMAEKHIPHYDGIITREHRAELIAMALPVAHAVWADLMSTRGILRLEHDHYLKRWTLTDPKLPCDAVLLDEAQDTNPAVAAMLLAQDHAQRIVVGDSAQAIYGWRGAVDALAAIRDALGAPELTLSKSFRFGQPIADVANLWLDLIGAPLRISGFEERQSMIGAVVDPDAILCRSNAGAMGIVMDSVAKDRKTALVGGGAEIKRLAWAAQALLDGRPCDHPELLGFPTWQAVREHAAEEDGALKVMVELIDTHGTVPIVEAADALVPEEQAEVVVSTVHKAKGREWNTVRIHDDFRAPKPDPQTEKVVLLREEGRLAYVAVTRAREVLDASALNWIGTVDKVVD